MAQLTQQNRTDPIKPNSTTNPPKPNTTPKPYNTTKPNSPTKPNTLAPGYFKVALSLKIFS
jgi:hypothetical protein